ncbi:MAG: hypothetical protein JXB88_16360, partial [Spirochaetales bacterium]|nr:hypothetical protein [Spirochaetales bacterium]
VCMRKALLLLVFIALPLAAFAEFQIGATALYNVVFAPDEARSVGLYAKENGVSLDDFTLGVDARIKLGMLQVSALGLISLGYDDLPMEVEFFLDVGIAIDLLFLRVGIGLGPNFIIAFGDEEISKPVFFGGNIKLIGEIMLGGISVGINYLMYLPDFSKESFDYLANNIEGNIGFTILFKL